MSNGHFVQLTSFDGKTFEAWTENPEPQGPDDRFPSILLLPEAFNVNTWARFTAQRYASLGYNVLVPDLHWRIEPGVHLPYTPTDRVKARSLASRHDYELAHHDLATGIDWLRAQPNASGKVGVVGYCQGGQLAFVSGYALSPDAVVGYYSSNLDRLANQAPRIKAPALFHFAEKDEVVAIEAVDLLNKARRPDQVLDVHVYPDAEHGFCRIGEAPYQAQAAEFANLRTLQHFERWLK